MEQEASLALLAKGRLVLQIDVSQADLQGICLDVRSPQEFAKAHIPGALSLPLLLDDERAQVGTCYQRRGREPAVLLGLRLVGARLADLAEQARAYCKGHEKALVYCWRGGERSASMVWLLQKVGLNVAQLQGGYKAYRQFIRSSLERQLPLRVLGGFTGSGKTEVLGLLRQRGEQVIDLEGLAHHRGSAFGHLGQKPQPSGEMFENLLAQQWLHLDSGQSVWIEDESHLIGSCYLPDPVWNQMRAAPLIFLNIPQASRIDYLLRDYPQVDAVTIRQSLERIERRLGGLRFRQACDALERKDWRELLSTVLSYYDQAYTYGMSRRSPQARQDISLKEVNPAEAVRMLLQ